jgi:hypothetical protein
MKTDPLEQYIELRGALEAEKLEIEERLGGIDKALGAVGARPSRNSEFAPPKRRGLPPGTGRHGNPLSLKTVVLQVTRPHPMARQEILDAVLKAGYKFVSKDPMNSLSTLLYTAKEIRNYGGKFGPV